MTVEQRVGVSLVDQILVEMFTQIAQSPEFDPQTIGKLEDLAVRGDLSRHEKVADAIKVVSRRQP